MEERVLYFVNETEKKQYDEVKEIIQTATVYGLFESNKTTKQGNETDFEKGGELSYEKVITKTHSRRNVLL